jgi:hypothetical protein
MSSVLEPGPHSTSYTILPLLCFIPTACMIFSLRFRDAEHSLYMTPSWTYLVSRGHKLVITHLLLSPPCFSGHSPKLYPTYRMYLFHSVSVRSTDDVLILYM